jgi:hypothetical protein
MDHSCDEGAFEANDLAGTLPHPRVRLDTLRRVRRELARVYVEARDGRRPVAEAARLSYMLATLGRLIEGAEVEGRLATLEKRLGDKR